MPRLLWSEKNEQQRKCAWDVKSGDTKCLFSTTLKNNESSIQKLFQLDNDYYQLFLIYFMFVVLCY